MWKFPLSLNAARKKTIKGHKHKSLKYMTVKLINILTLIKVLTQNNREQKPGLMWYNHSPDRYWTSLPVWTDSGRWVWSEGTICHSIIWTDLIYDWCPAGGAPQQEHEGGIREDMETELCDPEEERNPSTKDEMSFSVWSRHWFHSWTGLCSTEGHIQIYHQI